MSIDLSQKPVFVEAGKLVDDAELARRLKRWLERPDLARHLIIDLDLALLPHTRGMQSPSDWVTSKVRAAAQVASVRIVEEGTLAPAVNYAMPYVGYRFDGDRWLVVQL